MSHQNEEKRQFLGTSVAHKFLTNAPIALKFEMIIDISINNKTEYGRMKYT